MFNSFVLILLLATSPGYEAGATSVVYEFPTFQACENAGKVVLKSIRDNSDKAHVIAFSCVPRNVPVK